MARKGKASTTTAEEVAPASVDGTGDAAPEIVDTTTAAEESVKENGTADETNAVNGDTTAPVKDEKKKVKKPLKKSVPEWATLSNSAKKSQKTVQMSKPKVQELILAAIQTCGDSKGVVSAGTIKKYVMAENPDLPKMVLKKGVLKAIERGLIKQVKGKGFSGSFKLESPKNVAKAKAKEDKAKAKSGVKDPLESVFPSVFTWATNPKESSVMLIKKYIAKHYPELDVEGKAFRNAIESAETKGQLKRLTGKGFSGTFELVDGANKTGSKYEDAIENAVISMNEPKQVSVSGLRDYLSCWHSEYNTDNRPQVLKSALDRCSERGWIQQVSGKGFAGSYRLMYPYYPSPRELWGSYYEETKSKTEAKVESPRKAASKRAAPVEEYSDDDDDVSDDDEVMPTPKKRGAPKARSSAAPAPKKKKTAGKAAKTAKKTKPATKAKGKKSKKRA